MPTRIYRCEFEPVSKPITSAVTKLGGCPALLTPIEWPMCVRCGAALQFLAQISLEKPFDFKVPFAMAYIFICPDEESCNTAHPAGGANAVLLQSKGRRLSGAKTVPTASPAPVIPEYKGTITKARHEIEEDGVVSKIAGEPDWIQDDETPGCTGCGQPMEFVAQILAELPGHEAPANPSLPKMNAKDAAVAVERAIRSSSEKKICFYTQPSASRNVIGINGVLIASVRPDDTFPLTLQVLQLAKQLRREIEMQGAAAASGNKFFLPFGDAGVGYVFMCRDCTDGKGAFLWQTT